MFTGIIEELGTIREAGRSSSRMRLTIHSPGMAGELVLGESVAVNGVCLTVETLAGPQWSADVSDETLRRTNLESVRPGHRVNLERAMRLGGRLGGHLVQGHVDATVDLAEMRKEAAWATVGFDLPQGLLSYVVEKGSITVNGISLTVAALKGARVEIAVIPHTLESTTLSLLAPGDGLNIEVDIIGKYVEKCLKLKTNSTNDGDPGDSEGLSQEKLAKHGFL